MHVENGLHQERKLHKTQKITNKIEKGRIGMLTNEQIKNQQMNK